MSDQIPFTLDAPGTFIITSAQTLAAHDLTKFGLSLRRPDNRQEFLADEEAYMRKHGLDTATRAMVSARDWTGLIQAGGHLQSMLKIAATVGQNLWDIGAHNTGMTAQALMEACPRRVEALPGGSN